MTQSPDEGKSTIESENALTALDPRSIQRLRRPRLLPMSRAEALPCSCGQERLWFLHLFGTMGPAYNMPGAFRLQGNLNVGALERSISDLTNRHESLRTYFYTIGGSPFQAIDPPTDCSLEVVDLSHLDKNEQEQNAQRLADEEAQRPFNLAVGPLFRTSLLKLSDHEHVLLLTLHHIVSDGWSIGVLFQDLGEFYGARIQQRAPTLPELPVQPADHAIWQRECLRGEELDMHLGYWRGKLEGLASLELPTDRARPAMSSFKGSALTFEIPAELSAQLRVLCRSCDVTLYMLLLAAFQVLLGRYCGQSDIVVGSPIAGRVRQELEGLIGFFVNTLVLRTDLYGNPTFREVLDRVKATALEAYAHQEFPFEKLVQELRPVRDLSKQPLFQVLFGLHNFPREPLELAGIRWSAIESEHRTALFDLSLHFFDGPQGNISGLYEYATDLFERGTIERMAVHLLRLLRSIVVDVNCSIQRLQIVGEQELEQVVRSFNSNKIPSSSVQCVHELFMQHVALSPDAPAVLFADRTLTYAELNRRSNQLARYLVGIGVGPDHLVGICLERSLEMVVAVLGVLKAGAAYLPLDPSYPEERLRYMVQDAAPQAVLMHEATRKRLPTSQTRLIAIGETAQEFALLDDTDPSPDLESCRERLVFVIYTSGSSGQPKGVAMPHRSMVNLMEWHRSIFGSAAGLRILQFAALSFDASFHEIFSTLSTGGALVLLEEWVRRDARALTQFLRAQNVARLFIPPLMLQSLAEFCVNSGELPDSLQDVISAGEQLRITPEIVKLFKRLPGCRLHNDYGPTETHVVTALTLSGDPEQWPIQPSIGRPIANTQVYLLDEDRQPVPIGVRGEIYIGGAAVARGYLRRPDLSSQRFLADPFSADPQARLYKTGDVGRWRADGTLEFLGRNDDQLKIRGYRIEPGEIEVQLARHPHVKEAVVLARELTIGVKSLVAYITARDGGTLVPEDLRAHLQVTLPAHMVPSAFVLMDRLPLTPVGKLDRQKLLSSTHGSLMRRQYEAPAGLVEETLAKIWQALLGLDRVGRFDNYFELGGHSLLSTKLLVKVSEELQVELSVVAVFRHPTIEALAKEVESLRLAAETLVSDPREIEEGAI